MRLKSTRLRTEETNGTGTETDYYVLGGAHVGAMIARRLHEAGHAVTVVDETHDSAELPGLRGDPQELQTLQSAGITDDSTVIVAMRQDSRSLLVAQLVRVHFDAAAIHVLVDRPDNCGLVAAGGHEPICATTALSEAIVGELERLQEDA